MDKKTIMNINRKWKDWRLEEEDKESVNEAVKVQAGSDPLTVQDSLLDAFKGIVAKGTINWGYSESDQYGWNDFSNFKKMNDEYNKEMLKIGKQVEGISKQLEGMWKVYEKVKGKWRKKDGPRTN
jgi:hypothetical protein